MNKSERIVPHIHCSNCGKSMPANRDFCSPECRAKTTKTESRGKMVSRLYTVALIIIFIALVTFTLFSGSE